MKKKIRISLQLYFLLAFSCFVLLGNSPIIKASSTGGNTSYRIVKSSTGEQQPALEQITIDNQQGNKVYIATYDAQGNAVTNYISNIDITYDDDKVVEATAIANSGTGNSPTINLKPKLPGTTIVHISFKDARPGLINPTDIRLDLTVTVPVEIDKSVDSGNSYPRIQTLYADGNTKDKIPLVMLSSTTGASVASGAGADQVYPLKLVYGDVRNYGAVSDLEQYVEFVSSNPNVVEVATNGAVTARGSGYAVITVTSRKVKQSGVSSSDTIKVFVLPRAKEKIEDSLSFDVGPIVASGSSFAFYHDALDASELCWKVYKTNKDWTNEVEILDTYKGTTSKYLSLDTNKTIDSVWGEGKAGYYVIYGYIKEEYKMHEGDRKPTLRYVKIKVHLQPNLYDMTKTLNVGDSLDIFNIFNIEYDDWKTHFEENKVGDIESWHTQIMSQSKYISLDEETGIITALKTTYRDNQEDKNDVGDIKIVFKDKETGINYTLTLRIVEGLLLSQTEIEIFVGQTYPLWVTNWETINEMDIPKWSVRKGDEKLISVSDDGVVTGLSPTVDKNNNLTSAYVIVKQKDGHGIYKTARCKVTVRKTVTNITVDPSEISMSIGEFKVLKATLSPGDLANPKIRWTSTDDSIVAISEESGKTATIEAKSSGIAVISAINEKNLAVGSCKVVIEEKITSIKFPQTDITVKLSLGNLQLKPTYTPASATATDLDWKSTNQKVATVDGNGLVSLKKSGTTSIMVSSKFNPAAVATCNITVIQDSTGLVLDTTSKTIKVGESFRITYYLNPKGTTDNVTWTVLGKNAAVTVKNGLVTGKKAGTAQIMAKTSNGLTATCEVTVTQDASGIKLDTTSLSLLVGEVYYAQATVNPTDTTDSNITWTSQNAKVATVTNQGKITAVAPGTTTITVKTKNNQLATMEVTVTAKVTGISLNYTEKTIVVKNKFGLVAIVEPKGASNQDVTWSSSNTKIATVSDNGTVKGISGGTAIITCTTNDGDYKASCVVNVKEPVTKVKLNKTSLKLGKGDTFLLKAKVKSTGSTNQKVKWSSNKNGIVSVDDRGKIRGLKVGKAIITCKATDGSGAEASCEVRVIRKVSSIKLNKTMITLLEGRTTKLTATIKPKNATYKQPKWSIDDEKVALVDSNGQVTALKAGTAKIKVTAKDSSGKKAYCVVNVLPNVPVTSIVAAQKDLVMVVGATAMVSVSVSPVTTTDKISYTCDNTNVAVVDSQSGKVRALKPGTATILITAGSGKQATVNVTVVGLNFSSYSMEQYDTLQLRVEGVTTGVSWDITDSSVATISTTGLVSAKKGGTTTAVATVNGAKLTCRITVRNIQ